MLDNGEENPPQREFQTLAITPSGWNVATSREVRSHGAAPDGNRELAGGQFRLLLLRMNWRSVPWPESLVLTTVLKLKPKSTSVTATLSRILTGAIEGDIIH